VTLAGPMAPRARRVTARSKPAPVAIDFNNRRQLARLVTRIENDPSAAAAILPGLWARTGRAYRIGITGPPGVGKSTLVDQLVSMARAEGDTVAVVAVDPSSPFSKGAILGDRVRMLRHSGDAGVYIRSMAARDHLGGLAATTRDVAYLLDAFGFGVILLETVGVGQSELDIMRVADTVVVVTAPGLGDSIQMLKAGILEIADVLVVNKSDRPGANATVAHLHEMRHLAPGTPAWDVPILQTVGTNGSGAADLWRAIHEHGEHLAASGELAARRGRRAEREVLDLVERSLAARVRAALAGHTELGELLEQAKDHALDPHSAASAILAHVLEQTPPPEGTE
jgi:LAO/AO transport system kinase